MNKELSKDAIENFEKIVDHYGLAAIVSALSFICSEKAIHIAENWQDAPLGKQWMNKSLILDRAHVALEELVD